MLYPLAALMYVGFGIALYSVSTLWTQTRTERRRDRVTEGPECALGTGAIIRIGECAVESGDQVWLRKSRLHECRARIPSKPGKGLLITGNLAVVG